MNRLFIIQVYQYLMTKYKLKYEIAVLIACQSCLESAGGSSHLVKDFNNYIGMRVPFVRPSTANNQCDSNAHWASYDNLYSCLDDYMLWLAYRQPLRKEFESLDLFSKYLKKYCPERDYVSRVMALYNQFINSKS